MTKPDSPITWACFLIAAAADPELGPEHEITRAIEVGPVLGWETAIERLADAGAATYSRVGYRFGALLQIVAADDFINPEIEPREPAPALVRLLGLEAA